MYHVPCVLCGAVIPGCALTGAGGGGFLAVILKRPEYRENVTAIIDSNPVSGLYM